MIHPEDRIAIYNSKIRRVASFKEVVEFLQLDGIGEQGPQGIQGIQGVKGEKGDKGDTGEIGPVGPVGPSGAQGVQGPKGDRGDGFSLTKIYSSVSEMNADFVNETIPPNSFVLINSQDADNGKLFVKDETEYSFQAQLSGVQGERGEVGPQGVAGVAGEQGPRGIQGLTGPQGPQGERGVQGPQGTIGPQGNTGPQGLKGDKGADGAIGPQGVQGPMGPQGTQGVKGDKGDQGIQGIQGPQGVAGVQGIKGDTGNGFSLAKVYASVAEMNADFSNPEIALNSFVLINSSDTDNGKLFVKGNTAYVFQSQLSGVKGDKGDRGPQGIQGLAGQQGLQGPRGEQGLQGAQGERGLQGLQGVAGPQGIRGEKGDTGETGPRGLQGLQGLAGATGAQGAAGQQGPKGDKGDKGADGITPAPKEYLFGMRSSNQIITKVGDKVAFGTGYSARGITYDTGTNQFSLKAGKTYRITFTTSVTYANSGGYTWFGLHNSAGTKLVDVSAMFFSMNAAYTEAYNGMLDVIYTPTENIEAYIRVNSINAAVTTTIKGGFTTLVVQEL